jgi:hypothetical protein
MAESAHYGVAMDDRLRGLNIQRRAGLQRLHRVRVLPSELRKTVVQEREASQRPVLQLQRTRSIERPMSPLAEKHSADSGSSAAPPPQIADLHCFEIHRTSSQSSAVPRSLLKTTFAHDWLCPSMRSDFLGQIWGNLSAKPCPSMPIRPQRGDGRHQPNLLLQKKKVDIWQCAESVSQHNRRVGSGLLGDRHGGTGVGIRPSVRAAGGGR